METQRIEQICEIVQQGLDDHRNDPAALRTYLDEHHVTAIDIAEALEDVERLAPAKAPEARGLLELAASRLSNA